MRKLSFKGVKLPTSQADERNEDKKPVAGPWDKNSQFRGGNLHPIVFVLFT